MLVATLHAPSPDRRRFIRVTRALTRRVLGVRAE
jgi:hypothetical protein